MWIERAEGGGEDREVGGIGGGTAPERKRGYFRGFHTGGFQWPRVCSPSFSQTSG